MKREPREEDARQEEGKCKRMEQETVTFKCSLGESGVCVS